MSPRLLYAITYTLMVREAGSRSAIEEWLEERANEAEMEELARLPGPQRPVTPKAEQDMLAVMAMGGGPAPRREKK